jgi:hypothetical protein
MRPCGVRRAARGELITTHSLVRDTRADFDEFDLAAGFAVEEHHGRQPPKGKTYGETYITEFHAEIAAMHQKGNVDKNAKVSPDQVREALRLLYPHTASLCPACGPFRRCSFRWGRRKKAGALEGVCGRAAERRSCLPLRMLQSKPSPPPIPPSSPRRWHRCWCNVRGWTKSCARRWLRE